MIIESIILNFFKNFSGEHTFIFTDINLVKGVNGSGKTTLVKDSLEFCIYGYCSQSLDKLPTRGESDKTSVTVQIKKDNDIFKITRKYPTDITIFKNGIKNELTNNTEKQKYLNNLFGDINYFRKFRMVDIKEGINILEEGKTSLKKTLLSFSENYFNEKRQILLDRKKQKEIYNKDKAIIYKHYPSDIRLKIINESLIHFNNRINNLNTAIRSKESNYNSIIGKKSSIESKVKYLQSQSDKTMNFDTCPTCKRGIDENKKWEIVNNFSKEVEVLVKSMDSMISEIKQSETQLNLDKDELNTFYKEKEKLNQFKLKLESRLKLKDYKWSNRDIEISKKSINELDKFYSECITNDIKSLEPIVNSITNKINFRTRFLLTDKGEFDIILDKDNKEYSYKDLSSGQRLIVSIAFQLALLLQKQDEGVIIADEGFGSLSEENLEMVFELFKGLPFQLIAIVHRMNKIPENTNVISL